MNLNLLTASVLIILLQSTSVLATEDSSSTTFNQSNTRLMPLAKRALEQKNPEAARNLLETMLQLDPTNATAHLYLGQAYALEKNYINARLEFIYCLKLKDQNEIVQAANQALLKLPKRFRNSQPISSETNDTCTGSSNTKEKSTHP